MLELCIKSECFSVTRLSDRRTSFVQRRRQNQQLKLPRRHFNQKKTFEDVTSATLSTE